MKQLGHRVVGFYWGTGISDEVPALTYYLVLSLAPFTLAASALTAMVLGGRLTEATVAREVGRFLPARVRVDLMHLTSNLQHNSVKLLIVAFISMLWTSSAAVGVIDRTVCRMTGSPRSPIIAGKLRNLLPGAALTLLLLIAVAAVSALAGFTHALPFRHDGALLAEAVNFAGALAYGTILFHYCARGVLGLRAAFTGALVSSGILVLAPLPIGIYFHFAAKPVAASIFGVLIAFLLGCFIISNGLLIGVGVAVNAQKKSAVHA